MLAVVAMLSMSSAAKDGKVALLVGGGPAPGINGVISAATIEARNHGLEVIGFQDFDDPQQLAHLAATSGLPPDQVRLRFGYLCAKHA
jgi:hypothetical protein